MEFMSSAARKEVVEIVNDLPDDEVPAARRYLQYLRDLGSDPYLQLDRGAVGERICAGQRDPCGDRASRASPTIALTATANYESSGTRTGGS